MEGKQVNVSMRLRGVPCRFFYHEGVVSLEGGQGRVMGAVLPCFLSPRPLWRSV